MVKFKIITHKKKQEMKSKIMIIATTAIVLGMGFLSSCQEENVEPEIIQLTEQESNDLLTLREEEKLARDVYLYAFDKYGMSVSENISISEQKHMDEVLEILTAYGFSDPASTEKGIFNNEDLQNIYDALIAKVDSSQLDALIVGATVEDLDIRDIDDFKARTDREDILAMYEVLECGSRNHMRAYYDRLQDEEVTYEAQYISQEELNAIVNSSHESCGSN